MAEQAFYVGLHHLHHLLVRVVALIAGQQGYLHTSQSLLLLLRHFLLHVRVSLLQLLGTEYAVVRAVQLCQIVILHVSQSLEECVVEDYDVTLRTPVGVQRFQFQHVILARKFRLYVVQHSPVARSPSVDALLHVAYDKVAFSLAVTHTFFQQHLEVLPLYDARVLKLVYHDGLQTCAYLFEDEGRVRVLYERVE